MCQGLAGGSSVVGGMAGGGEVGYLGRGLRGQVHDVLGDGACESDEVSMREGKGEVSSVKAELGQPYRGQMVFLPKMHGKLVRGADGPGGAGEL